MHTINSTCSTFSAYVDPLTGEGLLVAPRAGDDVTFDPRGVSLHAAGELAFLRRLRLEGFELPLDEDGGPWCHVGWTEDGREAFALYGCEPLVSTPTMEEQAEALAELRAAARLVVIPEQRRPREDARGAA